MTPRTLLLAGAGLTAGALLLWAFWPSEAQAPMPHIEVPHAQAAQTLDQVSDRLTQSLASSRAEVERLRALVDAERARRVAPAAPADPSVQAPEPQPVVAPAPAEVDHRDELIQAQAVHIGNLEAQVTTLTGARDQWRQAAQAAIQRANHNEMALQAQLAATRSAMWKGRIQGFAVGVGVGYVGGKLR